jgi:hypothetical protein
MKMFILAAAMAVSIFPALAADVGVSISIGQPGFYGHIDIGGFPQPQLVYPTPVIIQQAPVGVVRQPIYLHVPPGHAKNWSKHCRSYNACGQPVYFVQENWYNNEYAPRYREKHGKGHSSNNYDNDMGKRKNKHGKD